MKQERALSQRRELEVKMAKVFGKSSMMLSKGMQRILMDDLVTAFQNRVRALIHSQERSHTT